MIHNHKKLQIQLKLLMELIFLWVICIEKVVTEDGMVIRSKNKHWAKTPFSIMLIEEGISTCFNAQSLKAPSSIEHTEDGIYICSNDEHCKKAHLLIEVTEGGIVIFVKDKQPSKAQIPIEVTVGGIIICVNFLHSIKQLSSIS